MRLNKQKLCLRKTMEKIQNQEETVMSNNTCHQIKDVLCEREKNVFLFCSSLDKWRNKDE